MERKVRTPEEMKQIYIHVAGMVACKKEKKEIYAYLKGQGYKNPTDQYIKMTQSKDYQRILEQARQMRQKMGNGDPIETEPSTVNTDTAETPSEQPTNAVILNGVEYTKAEPEDLPKPKTEPKTEEVESYSDGMVFTEAVPVVPITNEEPKLKTEPIKEPPLGLMPRYVWIENRTYEILAAMERYSEAGMVIPVEWIGELDYTIQLERRELLEKTVK